MGRRKKIQPAKAHLSIKRTTADWQKLVLQNLWKEDTLSGLIERMNNGLALKARQRETEGQLRVYANHGAAMDAIHSCRPLSGMVTKDGSVWIAYRPTTKEFATDSANTTVHNWSRSALQLLKLQFNDDAGILLSQLCWFAPISVAVGDKLTLGSPQELNSHVNQYLLLLPKLGDGGEYQNMYYVIGSKWTERVRGGAFEQPQLPLEIFRDWLPPER